MCMALATSPITHASAVVATPGTSVGPSAAIPDNCEEVIVYNSHGAASLYVGIATAGGALTPGSTATLIPAGASFTFEIGNIKQRGNMAAAATGFVYDGTAALTAYITYVNRLGALQG